MHFDKIKRFVTLAPALCMLMGLTAMAEETTWEAYPNALHINVNGTYIDAPNYFSDKGAYVPLRAVSEGFGYEVIWNEDRSIDISLEKAQEPKLNKIEYQLPPIVTPAGITVYTDELTIRLNGNEVKTPHFLYEGTTFVPVSFFSNEMNCHVYEDLSVCVAKIYSPDYVTFADGDTFYYDGIMLNDEQYQDIVKFLNNAMGGAAVTATVAEQELAYLKASYLLGEKIAGDENFQAFCEQNNVDAMMQQLGISDEKAFRDIILKSVYYQYAVTDANALPYYTPTEEDLAAQLAKTEYATGRWMKAKHILIMNTEDDSALKQAEDILKQLKKNPEDFDKLMAEHSQDPGSKTYPEGYLFKEGDMVTEFYEGTLPLDEGEISGIVESAYGYHIILKVADYKDGVPYTEVQDELHLAYAQDQFSIDLQNALANINTVLNPEYTEQ